MAYISLQDMRVIESTLGMSSGYVIDLSNREFSELVSREIGRSADAPEFATKGSSKANRLRRVLELCSDEQAASLLSALWDLRELRNWTPGDFVEPRPSQVRARFGEVIERLHLLAGRSDTGALERFAESATLDELILAINRDISAGRHAAALDRLHTYCMKRFMHLATEAGIPCGRTSSLQSRAGRWLDQVKSAGEVRPITQEILEGATKVLQNFNDVRNKDSFAHDNEIVNPEEARLIFETIISILRFVATVERKGRTQSQRPSST